MDLGIQRLLAAVFDSVEILVALRFKLTQFIQKFTVASLCLRYINELGSTLNEKTFKMYDMIERTVDFTKIDKRLLQ